MRYLVWTIGILMVVAVPAASQDSLLLPEPAVLSLQDLEAEALAVNPTMNAALDRITGAEARIGGEGLLDPPQLSYRRNSMPGFRWGENMSSEWELMQMIRFPSKYGTDRELAEIQAEHTHHQVEETVNNVLYRLRVAYADLWYIQQKTVLERENLRIAERVRSIAEARYGVGRSTRNETLMADMLRTRVRNNLIDLRQSELGLKALLSSILNRQPRDTIGYAVVSESPEFSVPLDTLLSIADRVRPMLVHSSMGIDEREVMLSRARQGYLPDLRLGVMYMDSRMDGFGGWGVSATVTLPFAPWSLGGPASAVDESEAMLNEARNSYDATKNDVSASVKEAFLRVSSNLERMKNIADTILPDAEQSLRVSLGLYQNGEAGYETVHQAYSAYVESQDEYFKTRLGYEHSLADLRLATGYNGTFDLQ
jgi:cobalt-zinc-cadmium efflux system outer membrane protein